MKVIIFDMDGVLIDSEPAYLEMNLKMFSEYGIGMDDENYKALVGMPSLPMWTMLKEKYDLKNEVTDIIQREKGRMYDILNSELIPGPMDGVVDLLERLASEGFKLSVASSSAKSNIELILNRLNLSKYFSYVISGEEVINGKPAPDIFLKVADHFTQPADKCFVIEDSANGVAAANSAGMLCIGFKNNGSNEQDISKADLIINNFDKNNSDTIIQFINSN
ncbi:MAG: HAD family phosphatase [Ignavibacteria bacterium]